MKKYLFLLLILVACKTKKQIEKISEPLPEPVNESAHIKQDSILQKDILMNRGKPHRPPVYYPPPPAPAVPTHTPVIYYVEFNGDIVQGTNWNTNGPITCQSAGFIDDQIKTIMDSAAAIFRLFNSNITLTTDKLAYDAAPPSGRLKCIVTAGVSDTTWTPIGGFAQRNTFGQEQPCFVFSRWLNYKMKYVFVDIPHEAGHIFSLYDEFYNGYYCFCSVMGILYYKQAPDYRWSIHNGMNDTLVIQSKTF